MNETNDRLSSRTDNPFRMPEGYLDSFEQRLMDRIYSEEAAGARPGRPVWQILKPALTLAAMFALIFGMGYGVLSLTHTRDRGAGTTLISDDAVAEEELIDRSAILNYYQMDAQVEEEDTEIDDETIVSYLVSELSFADLAEYYAQSYQK